MLSTSSVIATAITPSENASSRPVPMSDEFGELGLLPVGAAGQPYVTQATWRAAPAVGARSSAVR